MGEAFSWGAFGASALLVGAVIAMVAPIGARILGMIMAFGAGVLVSALAFDLVLEAEDTSHGPVLVGLGVLIGAVVFFVGDLLIDRMGGEDRKSFDGRQAEGSGLAIVLGAVLDGIPESMVLGLGLLDGAGVSVAFVAAVFLSNLPEGLAATSGLLTSGWTKRSIVGLWAVVIGVSALASLAGYAVFDGASPDVVAFVLAFAGGAILCMLADTMMPEAYQHEGKAVGLFTALGFALAFVLHVSQNGG